MSCLCDKLNVGYHGTDMNGMPEQGLTPGDWKDRLQKQGVLWKRSTGQSKWMRRFVVVKDGWLLYYPETEKKEFPRRNFFNIHPKAAVPLGQCVITPSSEQGQQFSIILSSEEVEGNLTLAAENDFERTQWLTVLEKSKRITWENQQLSDNMIRQLDEQGRAMAQQKQDYFDRLQSEVLELSEEKEKTWELAKLNEELEKEKAKMESFNEEIKSEYDKVKSELEDMQNYTKALDTERHELSEQLSSQVLELESLAKEKEGILTTLKRQESVTEQLTQTEVEMKRKLEVIERQTESLLQEKSEAEMRLLENEHRTQELEEEKEMYNEQANELQSTIKDLTIQKEMTEAELKEEVLARMEAERRLKDAETSLKKLGNAVENETPNIGDDVKEQMVVNVNKLKDFFENLAQEAKVDPDAPVVVKNAIHARKTILRRNKTRKFERRKSSSMRVKSMNLDQILMRGSKTLNPRRAQSTFVRSNSRETDHQAEEQSDLNSLMLPPLKEVYSEHF